MGAIFLTTQAMLASSAAPLPLIFNAFANEFRRVDCPARRLLWRVEQTHLEHAGAKRFAAQFGNFRANCAGGKTPQRHQFYAPVPSLESRSCFS